MLIVQAGFGAGGAERVISMLSDHFAQSGATVHVTAFDMPSDGPYFKMHPDVETSALTGADGQWNRIRHVRRVVKDFQPDVAISFLTKVNVITLLATIGLRVPVIISERNNPILQEAHPLWNHMQGLLGRRAAKVVALTPAGLSQLQSSLRRRSVVIPNPVIPFNRLDQAANGDACHLVAIGRLATQKGFDMLLESMLRIHQANPAATLTIYGEGRQRSALEAQRDALGLGEVVKLPGTTTEAGQWALDADIVLGTSRYEGFHNVVAEALVSGIPVVAFDCEFGPSDLIEDGKTGFLIPLGDIDELAEKTLLLIRDPELRKSMSNASSGTRERLSPENVFAQWDQLIAEVRQQR
ncbi:MAG: glycosyltransferase family 4 protein [Ruegeria sp.]